MEPALSLRDRLFYRSYERTLHTRLLNKFKSRKKVDFIIRLEQDYYYMLSVATKTTSSEVRDRVVEEFIGKFRSDIRRKADYYAHAKYRGYRIQPGVFEQEFLETVILNILNPLPYDKNYLTFYERLNIAYRTRAIDVVRREFGHPERNKQTYFENKVWSLNRLNRRYQYGPAIDEQERQEARFTVNEILSNDYLTEDEKQVIRYIQQNPNYTFRKMAADLNFSDHKGAKRLFERASKKIQEAYSDEA